MGLLLLPVLGGMAAIGTGSDGPAGTLLSTGLQAQTPDQLQRALEVDRLVADPAGRIFLSDHNSGLWSVELEPLEGRPVS